MREHRLDRAIDWLRRAVQLESSNHWYQFFLAYLEDQAHATDQALSHYTAALALRPRSPWPRFSRAKIYRAMGQWDFALEDMKIALENSRDRPEAARVHLEMGYLYHEVGDFASARREYNRLIQLDGLGTIRSGCPSQPGQHGCRVGRDRTCPAGVRWLAFREFWRHIGPY